LIIDYKIRILHIDDNRLDRELVKEFLSAPKYQISEAVTRKELEELLNTEDFDIVLSDFNILGLNGLEVIDIVKKLKPDLPVILVTGKSSEVVAVEALKKGAVDYVIKSPKHIRRLPNAVDAVLEKKDIGKLRKPLFYIS
jgi:two-component system response regulator